jgi:hypothetical protein
LRRRCCTSEPPEVTFFTDRDLGLQFPAILCHAGLRVERHADHFAPNCPDEEWLGTVAARGWVAITHDQRIRYKPNELAAVNPILFPFARYSDGATPPMIRFVRNDSGVLLMIES